MDGDEATGLDSGLRTEGGWICGFLDAEQGG